MILITFIILLITCLNKYFKIKEKHDYKEYLKYQISLEYKNNANRKLKSINNNQINLNIYHFQKSIICYEKAGYNHHPDYKYCHCGWILK